MKKLLLLLSVLFSVISLSAKTYTFNVNSDSMSVKKELIKEVQKLDKKSWNYTFKTFKRNGKVYKIEISVNNQFNK